MNRFVRCGIWRRSARAPTELAGLYNVDYSHHIDSQATVGPGSIDVEVNGLPWADTNVLVLADAYQLVSRVPSAIVDLAYLDPPLPSVIHARSGGKTDREMREHLCSLGLVLQQTRRTLKPTGTVFVHAVPEMTGHIRLLLDQIFGRNNLRHEYVLPLSFGSWQHVGHDTVLFYSVGDQFVLNHVTRTLSRDELAQVTHGRDSRGPYRLVGLLSPSSRPAMTYEWRGFAPSGNYSWRYSMSHLEALFKEGRIILSRNGDAPQVKQYFNEPPQIEIGSVWSDLLLSATRLERIRHPSQKPIPLLERIIRIGSNPEALVLDPYCGSGTTLVAAQELRRRWIGGDNNPEAIAITQERLASLCKLVEPQHYRMYDEAGLRSSGPGLS
jgi:DNA modification methylase